MTPKREKRENFAKGKLPEPMTLSTFVDYVAEKLSIAGENLRYIGKPSQKVSTAGWCTGSGAEFIKSAYSEGVDVYITGDVKYHDAQMAMERGIAVIDAGHYGTEKIFAENMGRLLREKIESAGDDENGIEIFESKADINPFKQNGF